MKLGFFLGNGEKIGEKAEMGFRGDFAQRTEKSCDVLGCIFRWQLRGETARIAVLLEYLFGWRAVGQI